MSARADRSPRLSGPRLNEAVEQDQAGRADVDPGRRGLPGLDAAAGAEPEQPPQRRADRLEVPVPHRRRRYGRCLTESNATGHSGGFSGPCSVFVPWKQPTAYGNSQVAW